MQGVRSGEEGSSCAADALVHVLVVSQHDGVRRQLVAYLGRSSSLVVSGDEFSPEAIESSQPDVLVLDLSQLDADDLRRAIGMARRSGAGLIALASLRKSADEHAVVEAGGLYRLKSAGADGLVDVVRSAARCR